MAKTRLPADRWMTPVHPVVVDQSAEAFANGKASAGVNLVQALSGHLLVAVLLRNIL